jgi:L-seryl-tRNA(Ser) seleniumtransferase
MSDPRRSIPSVEALLSSAAFQGLLREIPRVRVASILRGIQNEQRQHALTSSQELSTGAEAYAQAVRARLAEQEQPSLQRLINATGVVLHTNLGRAPLAAEALDGIREAAVGYCSLEYDLEEGARGSRYDHCRQLLVDLTGAEDAIVVNNNAAALVLTLNTIANRREAIVSRGELVEIGGSFRVPEIMERSGARLREVGSTNRTHVADYRAAINVETAAILKVHTSNFRITGFTAEASIDELAGHASAAGLPLLHDLGSGLLFDLEAFGFPPEPRPQESLSAGADLVTMSGDKLLGGPQAGIIVGRRDLIAALRRNPLCRAFRVDKLTLAALEATLILYLQPDRARTRIPVLRMLTADLAALQRRALSLAEQLEQQAIAAEAVESASLVGGGAYPDVELPSAAVLVADAESAVRLEQRLRSGKPPVITRMLHERVALDLRTIDPAEEGKLIRCIVDAASGT